VSDSVVVNPFARGTTRLSAKAAIVFAPFCAADRAAGPDVKSNLTLVYVRNECRQLPAVPDKVSKKLSRASVQRVDVTTIWIDVHQGLRRRIRIRLCANEPLRRQLI
jgi:hypothetical protein